MTAETAVKTQADAGPEQPAISVVIPCFNAVRTLKRALDSVRLQDCGPIETIVVDDGSSDGTAAILARQEERGVRVIRSTGRQGASHARNIGIAAARGTFIAFLDADDEWLPGKLSLQMVLIRDRPAMTIVTCGASSVGRDGSFVPNLYPDARPAAGPEAWRVLLAENFIHTSSVLARRTAIDRVGGFDPALSTAEDQDLWIRLALEGELGYVDQSLVLVHDQPDSLCQRYPTGRFDFELPMILRHVQNQRHRLSEEEVRTILGNRFARIGWSTYQKRTWPGLGLILRAIRLGHRPVENLAYILRASPPARLLKRLLRQPRAMDRSPADRVRGGQPIPPFRRD